MRALSLRVVTRCSLRAKDSVFLRRVNEERVDDLLSPDRVGATLSAARDGLGVGTHCVKALFRSLPGGYREKSSPETVVMKFFNEAGRSWRCQPSGPWYQPRS